MASLVFQQAVSSFPSAGPSCSFGSHHDSGNASIKLLPKINRISLGYSTDSRSHVRKNSGILQASTYQVSVEDASSSPSDDVTNDKPYKANEAALILIRHEEPMWNAKNLFTGCVDVPLTKKGVEEAIDAGKRISNILVSGSREVAMAMEGVQRTLAAQVTASLEEI